MTGYNGWKNRSTWNVALWIENDEFIYRYAVGYAKKYGKKATYFRFIRWMRMDADKTPDGIKWLSNQLDYKALNEMVQELVS